MTLIHQPSISQDLPCSWPWGQVPKEPEPAAPEIKPKGRGCGRGRGRGKGSKSEDVGPAPKKDSKEKGEKTEKAKKGPFLLTNLVRVGNQMRGASTWSILQNALQKVIEQKLVLRPLSSRPQSALDQLKFNIEILKLLGKLPSGFDFNATELSEDSDQHSTANSKKQSELMESASELLRRHCCCWCHFVSPMMYFTYFTN